MAMIFFLRVNMIGADVTDLHRFLSKILLRIAQITLIFELQKLLTTSGVINQKLLIF